MKDLGLYLSDRDSLKDGEWLTDAVIIASQLRMKSQYMSDGFQSSIYGYILTYAM